MAGPRSDLADWGRVMSDINNNDPLVTRREFAQQGKFGMKTLSRIEKRGEGPPAIEITPGFIRYRQSAIDAWFAARTRTGAKAPARKREAV